MSNDVYDRVNDAGRQLQLAIDQRKEDSGERLYEIKKKALDEQFKALDDADLTADDKSRLRRHISQQLPAPKRAPAAPTLVPLILRLFMRLVAEPVVLVALFVAIAWATLAWQHTWPFVMRMTAGQTFAVNTPDGQLWFTPETDMRVPFNQTGPHRRVIRLWIPRKFYGESEVVF